MRKIDKMAHKGLELGVFEIGSIQRAKADLITARHESLQISDNGNASAPLLKLLRTWHRTVPDWTAA